MLDQQAAGILPIVQVGLERHLPVPQRGRRRSREILVDRLIERHVIFRPVQQQIPVGGRRQRLQPPGRLAEACCQLLYRRHHLRIVVAPPRAFHQVIQPFRRGLRIADLEPAKIRPGRGGAARQVIRGSHAYQRLIPFHSAGDCCRGLILLPGLRVLGRLHQAIAAMQHLRSGRWRIAAAHRVFQSDQRSRGARAGGAAQVVIVDPLVELRGVRQIVGCLVAIGQRHVSFGLRQLGVVIAQQAYRVGRRRGFTRACFHQPAPAVERRIAVRRRQICRGNLEIVRLHASQGQIVGRIIGERRQLSLHRLQFRDCAGVILLFVLRNAERQVGQRCVFRMTGDIRGDGAAPRRAGRFTVGAHQYPQRARGGGRSGNRIGAARPEGQDKCCRTDPDRHWLKFV